MYQNERDSGSIEKEITAKLVECTVYRKRDNNRNQKSNRTHSHPAWHQKKYGCRGLDGTEDHQVWIRVRRSEGGSHRFDASV
jgi:hypothetical protein